MRKQKISSPLRNQTSPEEWLKLDELADVEITSEAKSHPIEAALLSTSTNGWRADGPGEQTIRLVFHRPLALRRIGLVIEERECERTQQFVLRTAASPDGPWREVVRQQFNFSPAGATREREDYYVDLSAVRALELTIIPDISGGDARASLQELRLA